MNEEEILAINMLRIMEALQRLQDLILYMRQANAITGLRCRALSESITCAETAYLWLQQVPNNEIKFSEGVDKPADM